MVPLLASLLLAGIVRQQVIETITKVGPTRAALLLPTMTHASVLRSFMPPETACVCVCVCVRERVY
jgi:hypothetical protein